MGLPLMSLLAKPEPDLRYGSVCSGIEAVSVACRKTARTCRATRP